MSENPNLTRLEFLKPGEVNDPFLDSFHFRFLPVYLNIDQESFIAATLKEMEKAMNRMKDNI